MPGYWELGPSQRVLCCILHTDNTSIAWAFGLRNLKIPGTVMGLAGMPFDHARNNAAMQALEHGFDWLFFLDSDVIPPPDAVLRLMKHDQPIVSGVYHRRSHPHGIPVMLKDGQWIQNPPKNKLIDVDLVGAGCLLIHRSVLSSLPPQRPGKHWFDWRVDMKGVEGLQPGECMSEDFTFCIHAKRNGYRVLVDTSVICKHVGFAEFNHASCGPLDYQPV